MRKYRYLLLCAISLLVVLTAAAQTQQGYVKTLGRPQQAGVALSGVSVRVKGAHNAVLSKSDGTFSVLLTGKKPGDAYTLQQVQKKDYELNERAVIGRQYAYSDKVPLTIVMVSTAQLQADKQRIENKAYQVAERNYKKQLALIEKQKAENSITIEVYRQQLRELQDKFEKYQSLIDGLAEHYAHVDYDQLDEKEREINLCIENGELERADSLIHTLFDPTDVLKRNQEALARLDQQESQARELLAQANADWAAVLKQQEKDAEHLYQLYTIALSRFDNEKARQYIVTRAELDTTNVGWQNQAGLYISEYIGDYRKTMTYCQRVLRQSILQYGEEHDWTATAYNNIGYIYNCQGDYAKALEFHSKALAIKENVLGKEHPGVATSYNNIGLVYDSQGDYAKALEFHSKALAIREKVLGPEHPDVATSYNNIGIVYDSQGDYVKALEYYSKALAIQEKVLGAEHPNVASSYNNIGLVYHRQDDYAKALEYFSKALAIKEKVLGKEHPDVALSYNNIGAVYDSQGDYAKAQEFYFKALVIWENVLGPEHPNVATSYGNIAMACFIQKEYTQAIEYFKKALKIYEKRNGEEDAVVKMIKKLIASAEKKLIPSDQRK